MFFSNDNIKAIKNKDFVFSFLVVLLLIIPGLSFIFYFKNDLFIHLDFLKLILLSIGIITPFVLINFFVCLENVITSEKSEDVHFRSLVLSVVVSAFILFAVLTIFVFGNSKNFKGALAFSAVAEVIVFILMVLMIIQDKITNKKVK